MSDLPNLGDNIGAPYAEGVADRLELDYATLLENARDALSEADDMPLTVETSIDVSAVANLVVKLRDLAKRSESHRVAEGAPYLRSKEAVDSFFQRRLIEPLKISGKGLQARIDAHKQRQLAQERARREAEAAAARKAQEEARRQREEAEAAARRARSEESARLRAEEAAAARVEEEMARGQNEEATLSTMVKSSEMVRERFEGTERSGMVTMRKQQVVFIDDVAKLDLELLRPFIKEEHLLMALRAWARATNFSQEMPGATVALRDATVVR